MHDILRTPLDLYQYHMYSAGPGLFRLLRSKFSLRLLVILCRVDPVLGFISL